MFAHQAGGARDCRIRRTGQGVDDVLLLISCAVLAQLELGFELGDSDFESHDVAEHALAVSLTEAGPLLLVGSVEGGDEIVKNAQ